MSETLEQKALKYHKKGKIGIKITKDLSNKDNFKLAYSPGVAFPCLEIEKDNELAYEYTAKGNLVAVITNSTAVLGLGDIGAIAGKPVMEGKALLFKYLAGIDSIDIEIDNKNTDEIVKIIKDISCTFGGINIEDIAAPECFEIIKRLEENLNIPTFHDDQTGTAIVVSAALQNALKLIDKKLENVKIIMNGAGAAALACAKLLIEFGAQLKNLYIFDSQGLLTTKRNLNSSKKFFAHCNDEISLNEALKNADVFIGLSKGNVLSASDIINMAKNPIILPMANPTPEIDPILALQTRNDAIIGTGRADFPNQVNNVLCFPFLFRAALDVRSSKITLNMQKACCEAIMKITQENPSFNKENIIPNPFNPVLIYKVSKAVADAAIQDKVAKLSLPKNYNEYLNELLYDAKFEATFIPSLDVNSSDYMMSDYMDFVEILKEHGVTKKSDKKIYILNNEEILNKIDETESCLIITKDMNIGFKMNFTINVSDLKQFLKENHYIGLIYEDKIFFNNANRIWYANLLCSEEKISQ